MVFSLTIASFTYTTHITTPLCGSDDLDVDTYTLEESILRDARKEIMKIAYKTLQDCIFINEYLRPKALLVLLRA
jgi:hypothetical protein